MLLQSILIFLQITTFLTVFGNKGFVPTFGLTCKSLCLSVNH